MATTPTADDDWSLYPYDTVKPLPFIFAVIIFILLCINAWQNLIVYKWRYFAWIMTWASAIWTVGFACRAYSQYHTQDIGMYVAQYVLILFGPTLYAASELFILGRILAYLPYLSPLHPGRVVSTFLCVSAVIEVLVANGAVRVANADLTDSERSYGLSLVEVGLIMQTVVEVCFFALAAMIYRRAKRAGTLPRQVKIMIYVICFTSLMMLVRCIFRTVEGFEAGQCISDPLAPCGTLNSHAVYLWIFEVANVTLFVVILTAFAPGRYLPHSDRVFLDPLGGQIERLGPGFAKADQRPRWVTFLDPFDIVGRIRGKRSLRKYWEEDHPIYKGQEVFDTRSRHEIPIV